MKKLVLLGLTLALTFALSGTAFAATITQTPNFNGLTLPANSAYTINWTSTGLPGPVTLVMRETYMTLPYNDTIVTSALTQSGSYTVTVPAGPVGGTYCFYLVSSDGSTYSDAAYAPWKFTIGPPAPVVSTPASSPWSMALMAVLGLGIVAVGFTMTRRASSKSAPAA